MNYKTYIGFFLFSFALSFVCTPLVRLFSIKAGVLDFPGERKIHSAPIPRLGGVALFFAFSLPWTALYVFRNRITEQFVNYETLVGGLLVAVFFIVILGIYDDFKGADATKKFTVQVLLGIWLYLLGYRIDQVTHPFGGEPYVFSEVGSFFVSILWIVGITNAINLIDGINGLASGIAAGLSLTLAVINILHNDVVTALMTTSLAGSCFGFLPYNFPKAKIFLGDSGSLFLGLALAAISMISFFKAATVTFVFTPIILFGLPILDTGSTVLRRLLAGQPIFQADKQHLHHRIMKLGYSQRRTAVVLYGMSSLFGLLAVILGMRNAPRISITFVFLGLVFWAFFILNKRGDHP